MLSWIKLETGVLYEPRVRALMGDCGVGGFGCYVIVRLAVESAGSEGMPMEQVLGMGLPWTRRRMMRRVIEDYGLFEVVKREGVEFVFLARAPAGGSADMPAGGSAGGSGHTPAGMPADEPLLEKERKDIKERPTPTALWDYATDSWYEPYSD